jgi:hypothetical protein
MSEPWDALTTSFADNTDGLITAETMRDQVDAMELLHSVGATSDYRAITALRTLDATDFMVECTSGTYSVTLPTAVGISGKQYTIKNSGTGVVTIDADGTETIDGSLTKALVQYNSLTIMSNNTGWIIL